MSGDRPERPPAARFLSALEIERNAKVGLVSGVSFAALVFFVFVVLAPDRWESPILLAGLGFVLAVTVAGIVALAMTVRSAVRLSRNLEDEEPPAFE